MALSAGTTLQLGMGVGTSKKNFNVKYANASALASDIKAAGQALIRNADIFNNAYDSLQTAVAAVTSTTEFDLSD